jgi:hypothetical protein
LLFSFSRYFRLSGAVIVGLALLLIFASSPSMIGWTISSVDGKPALSLDLCHPVGACEQTTVSVLLAPSPPPPEFGLPIEASLQPEATPSIVQELTDPPDPPPPRS